jgi:tRNA(Ile)-lysidine synthase
MPATTIPLTDAEAAALFADLAGADGLLLAISGGPDSTALMTLMARWRAGRVTGPRLVAATVDHGLRPEARAEADTVGELAARLGIAHQILRWRGRKPTTGIQEAARAARYRLLAAAARKAGMRHVVTAHTLDDQVETVLFRLARGSGIAGLSGMAPVATVPGAATLRLVRPLLGVPKARLIATLEQAGLGYARDPSNLDPRFARPRLRKLIPLLTAEGFDAGRLSVLAARARQADEALAWMTAQLLAAGAPDGALASTEAVAAWPAEIVQRALAWAIRAVGDTAPALGKLEVLAAAVRTAAVRGERMRRTLAGAVVTVAKGRVSVRPAPARRHPATGHLPARFTRNDP